MRKIIIITVLATTAIVLSLVLFSGSGIDANAVIQSDCERAVQIFTEEKPVTFVGKIDKNNDEWPDEALGRYLFEDLGRSKGKARS